MPKQRVDFTEVNNPMLRFLLDDGTEINVKVVIMGIVRCDEQLPDGQLRHEFNIQVLTDQIAPAGPIDVRKLAGGER